MSGLNTCRVFCYKILLVYISNSILGMASNNTVFVLDAYHADVISRLQQTPNITLVLQGSPRVKEWHEYADAVILRSETRLTAEDFSKAARLRVVVKQGVGVDNIDMEAAKRHNIAVHNTPALNSESVPELCLALTLSLTRRVCELDRRVRNGEKVIRSNVLGTSMYQKTVGVIGMGNIGKLVAKKWKGAFECNIVAYDPMIPKDAWSDIPHDRANSLEPLLRTADVITLHVPLLGSTRGLIDEEKLKMMKTTAVLVNCARGGVVDEKALTKALKDGAICGAVLDAMEVEPPTREAYGELLQCDNVIVTPHVGASTIENQSRSGLAVVDTVLAVFESRDAPGKLA
jgi:D-3-phosphoglycerate dehydrogenase